MEAVAGKRFGLLPRAGLLLLVGIGLFAATGTTTSSDFYILVSIALAQLWCAIFGLVFHDSMGLARGKLFCLAPVPLILLVKPYFLWIFLWVLFMIAMAGGADPP